MPFPLPDYHNHEEFQNRSRKLAEIRALGIDPYPPKYVNTQKTAQIILESEEKEVGHYEDACGGKTQHIFVSGRLVLFRAMGKNAFAHIQDETGRVQLMFNNLPSMAPYVRAGKLRGLGVTGSKRSPVLPELPTIAEAGVAGYEVNAWSGIIVPTAVRRTIASEPGIL